MSDTMTVLLWSAGMLVAALGWVRLAANEIFRLSVEIDPLDLPTESARSEILRGLYSVRIVLAAILLALLFGFARLREHDLLATILIIATTAALFALVWQQSRERAAALADRLKIGIRFGGKLLGGSQ